MDASFLSSTHCVGIGRRAFQQLRASLEREVGAQAAQYLQEAGFAGGAELYAAFASWAHREYGLDDPADLDAAYMSEAFTRFFGAMGWGALATRPLGDAVLALDAIEWAEAGEAGTSEYPSCHVTCGMLAEFLGRLSGQVTAVMQVECPSRGDARARFLAGAPDTLSVLYDRMSQGMTYTEALGLGATASAG
jgi:predicted hydrocarbon binding protein